MADILVRDVDPGTKTALKSRAKRNGRSLSAEVSSILQAEVLRPEPEEGFGTYLHRRFREDVGLTDAEWEVFNNGVEEARRQPGRPPPDFGE